MITGSNRAIATVAALGLLMAGCAARDRAGGQAADEVVTLTFAQPVSEPPSQIVEFAALVEKASNGTLKIKFENAWRAFKASYEAGTIKDVQAGEVDMAWVGARAFDRAGLTSFQALLAPLLVDSYDLQAAVFDDGIPQEMLAGLETLDLAGVGVLPGPMRKLFSKSDPLTAPSALKGKKVGIQASEVAARTFAALGATTLALPSVADLSFVDAYEQQLSSIAGNNYEERYGGSTVGNLNLWPRPLVIFMGKAASDKLTQAQRDLLHRAAADAVTPALEASRYEDTTSIGTLCEAGMTLPAASESDLTAWRQALEPVYTGIAKIPDSAAWLARIQQLKSTLASGPDTASCPGTQPTATSTSLDGTYTKHLTGNERCLPTAGPTSVDMKLADGWATVWVTPDGKPRELVYKAKVKVLHDRLSFEDVNTRVTMTWRRDDNQLVLSDLRPTDCLAADVLASRAWTKVS